MFKKVIFSCAKIVLFPIFKNSTVLFIKMVNFLYNNNNNKLPLTLLINILNPLLFTFNSQTPLTQDLQKSTLKNYNFLWVRG